MCKVDGVWNERLHQETVNLCMQDLNEGKKGRGCVNKADSKHVLESDRNRSPRERSINTDWKQRLKEAVQY